MDPFISPARDIIPYDGDFEDEGISVQWIRNNGSKDVCVIDQLSFDEIDTILWRINYKTRNKSKKRPRDECNTS